MYTVVPFLNPENLRDLISTLSSCIGPYGTLKMFVTSAGQIRVTKCSRRVADSLISEINDPAVEAILNLMKNHTLRSLDFGLSLGVLTSSLMNFDTIRLE